jgi:hypothetical protein
VQVNQLFITKNKSLNKMSNISKGIKLQLKRGSIHMTLQEKDDLSIQVTA